MEKESRAVKWGEKGEKKVHYSEPCARRSMRCPRASFEPVRERGAGQENNNNGENCSRQLVLKDVPSATIGFNRGLERMEKRRETLLSSPLERLVSSNRAELREMKRDGFGRGRAGGERAAVFGRWEKQVQEREAGLGLNFVSSFGQRNRKIFQTGLRSINFNYLPTWRTFSTELLS